MYLWPFWKSVKNRKWKLFVLWYCSGNNQAASLCGVLFGYCWWLLGPDEGYVVSLSLCRAICSFTRWAFGRSSCKAGRPYNLRAKNSSGNHINSLGQCPIVFSSTLPVPTNAFWKVYDGIWWTVTISFTRLRWKWMALVGKALVQEYKLTQTRFRWRWG